MARQKSIEIRRTLKRLIPAARLKALAKQTGAVRRERKIGAVALFWTLVLGFATGNTRSIAGLRRAFEKASGTTVVPSAFYDRLTPGLARLLRAALVELIGKVGRCRRALEGTMASFRDVIISDSTIVRLHDLLERAYPGTRTHQSVAALKAHVILSVTGRGPRSVKLTSERAHDGPVLRAGAWVRDRLLIFDLGYYRFQLFSCISRQGGFFLTRLKDGSNPLITSVHRAWRGKSVPVVGEKLQSVLGRLQRQVLDAEVELRFQNRAYRGKRSIAYQRIRLVGVRDERAGKYHLYLTNIPADRLDAEDIARTYRARWLVELAFRELKAQYRLDQMPSSKRHVVEALLYAAFIAFMVSRALVERIRRLLPGEDHHRLREERWAVVFASAAVDLLALVLRRGRAASTAEPYVERMIRREAIDPNKTRVGLLAFAQAAVLQSGATA
jgi:putative transposase